MPNSTLLATTVFLIFAAPALAGVSMPELPRLDFGDPQETCFPPQTCDGRK